MTNPAAPPGLTNDALEAFYGALLDDDPTALYERAPCGYLSTLPDGTIIKVNETFLTLTGYSRRDLVGRRTFAELLTPGGRIYHETHYAPMLQMQGSASAIALELICADQSRLAVLVNAVLERGADGQSRVVRTAIFDATERRQYERELLRAKERAEVSEQRAASLARALQRTLIPPTVPSIPGLDLAAAYRAAGDGDEVGGDFYDVFEIGAGDWVIAIGDVEGKGVDAAVVTSLARHTMRAAAVNLHEPSAILTTLNTVLLHDDTKRFCTVALARLREIGARWTVAVSQAGHPAPLLRAADGEVSSIGAPGTLLGFVEVSGLAEQSYALTPGDVVLFYTDGVTEARGSDGFFGEGRLIAALKAARGDAGAITEGLLQQVLAFQHGRPRDDIAIVTFVVQ